jgi:2-oxo-4-hydroxy-4-carboxy-5-ureidoimidazoline decarboxylase
MHDRPSEIAALTLEALDALDRAAFAARLGGVFEHSPWVAERAWAARPFASVAALHAAMVRAMRAGSAAEQTALLRAHPELAGREAREGRLTAASSGEQKSAGLDRLDAGEARRLADMNAVYRERFGFPFIIAVRARTKDEILAEFARRLGRGAAEERETALGEVEAIARIRLERLFGAAGEGR